MRLLSGEEREAEGHRAFVAEVLGGQEQGLAPEDIPESADQAANRLEDWCAAGDSGRGRPTILLDEAGAFVARCERRFLERLRGMLSARRVALVFSTWQTLDDIYAELDRNSPFGNLMGLTRVPLLDEAAARAIVARGDDAWQADDPDWMLDWAGTHAFYLTLLARHLFDVRGDGRPREQALDAFRDQAETHLRRWWRTLGERDQGRLRDAAAGKAVDPQGLRQCGLVTGTGRPFARVLSEWLNET